MLHGCVDAHIARLVMQTYRPRIRTLAEDSALCPRPWAPDLLRVIVKFVVSTCALIFRPRVLRLSVCPCLRVRNKTPVLQFKWNTWPLPCGSCTRLFRCLLAHAHVQAPGTKRSEHEQRSLSRYAPTHMSPSRTHLSRALTISTAESSRRLVVPHLCLLSARQWPGSALSLAHLHVVNQKKIWQTHQTNA